MRIVGQVIDKMRAGLLRMGQWMLGAGLAALVALAHAQPSFAPHGGGGFHGGGGGGFGHAPMMREATPMHWGGAGAVRQPRYGNMPGGGARYNNPAPMRVADQGGWRERGAPGGGRQAERRETPGFSSNPYGNGFSNYRGPIQPVSAETRQVPHPPADSPVRAGSIREDVARYNEERGTFRPFQRGGGDGPRPPMPSPYRN
ncbi:MULTISPECIES: hypothetical protein [unclassified Paraburkholderia]|uniref:hypothetical protein n=1 Tax=unclassified Paraburkholderia TaxID=2615204 RepID=UPI002AB05594|nr:MULTISPECIES: hypothetical protein [unclassified Paraburkholderia]